MTFIKALLVMLFGLVGAHVPKAFTVLYFAIALTWVMSRWFDPQPWLPLPGCQGKQLRLVQVLVLLFSLAYPLALISYGIWQLNGRQLLDVVSAFLLPSGLLWWGAYLARRHIRLLSACLLSYCIGALIFLVAALCKTRGFDWFGASPGPASLLMAWGAEASMNVRSVEQNGILNIVIAPIGIWFLLKKRYWWGLLLLALALVGLCSVLPLLHGRLWIISLTIASYPLVVFMARSFLSRATKRWPGARLWLALPVLLGAFLSALIIPNSRHLCDERFAIYGQALRHWPELISGGRQLSYDVLMCDGLTHAKLSLRPGASSSFAMLHSVFLDVLATAGWLATLPMLLFLVVGLFLFVRLVIRFCCQRLRRPSFSIQVIWSFLAVIIPQWLFQPLVYGDGLLYYLSYAAFGALLVIQLPAEDQSLALDTSRS